MNKSPRATSGKLEVKKVSQLIADDLKAEIIRGNLKAGDALPSEAALTEVYGVSRPTFREAIRILESEDLVRTTRGGRGGARVRHPTAERAAGYAGLVLQLKGATIRDVLRVRSAIIPPAAMLAAQHAADSDLSPLTDWVSTAEFNPKDIRRNLLRIHELEAAIIELSRSETMKLVSQMLTFITADQIWKVPATVEDLPKAVVAAIPQTKVFNRRLVAAIVAGDCDAAFAVAQERMIAEGRLWDSRAAYQAPVKMFS